ncbi:hypothetical protein [Escherichia coli]|uniref:hypothetical protein n=1 Tax=Escherichia coli TaxID=562 RepID=UPI000A3617C4|nr:hypothetical protein [Escherichia coli]
MAERKISENTINKGKKITNPPRRKQPHKHTYQKKETKDLQQGATDNRTKKKAENQTTNRDTGEK